jgi:DNA-nicking Smr family endonuclease
MGRKRRKPRPPILTTAPQEEDFYRPFSEVREKLRDAVTRPAARPPTPKPAPVPSRQVPDPIPRQATVSTDERARRERALFLSEMTGVTPLPKDPRGHVDKPRLHRRVSAYPEPDALDELRDLVEGRGAFSIQSTDEYMEGVAPGVDHRLPQRLHRGDFAVQAQCDLHGHTVEEAKVAVQRFVTQAHTAGQRCVRVIHGRGRNSRDNRPVLKEQVQVWLSHGRLSRLVLAFATAPAADGGAGAVYVLLRRASAQRKPSG